MSNVMNELKAEISRLARKEVHRALAPVRKIGASQRSLIAGLRRQVGALQKELKALGKATATAGAVAADSEAAGPFRITGKGVKALRKRLGLTQGNLGRLAGVSGPAVVNWEKHAGRLRLRKATAGKLQEIRGLKKRDVAARLGQGGPKKAKAKRRAKA
jgi:DNA-binding transcriptional regulator YiaG